MRRVADLVPPTRSVPLACGSSPWCRRPPRCCSPSASATTSSPSPTSATTPPEARELPQVTRDVIGPGLAPAEIDRAVRELTERGGRSTSSTRRRCGALRPDLIVTQALCAVCAVSYDDVSAVAERLDPVPEVISLDPHTLGEVLGDVRTLAQATGLQGRRRRPRRRTPRARIDRVRLAVRDARAGPRRRARVAGPDLRRGPLDAAADRVRRRHRRARHARRALRAAHVGGGRGRRGPRWWS